MDKVTRLREKVRRLHAQGFETVRVEVATLAEVFGRLEGPARRLTNGELAEEVLRRMNQAGTGQPPEG